MQLYLCIVQSSYFFLKIQHNYCIDETNWQENHQLFLTIIDNHLFANRYDFIWLENIIHYLTPNDLKRLNTIFQKVLKPK